MDEFFPEVDEPIPYEGPESDNPLAFRYYDPERVVGEKTMAEHLRFSVCYWHSFRGRGEDMFGSPTKEYEWLKAPDPMQRARDTMRAAFEFFRKLGVDFYCFHDRDIAPAGGTFAESCENLRKMAEEAKQYQEQTGVNLLWGTSNLFSNPMYANGAATNPDADVFARAAAQVKNTLDVTNELGGENYVFWGGREGYSTLLNTDLEQEREQMARFFRMAVEYKNKIGFDGQLLIEPKPAEPMKHQYDHDAATVIEFLRAFDLLDNFKLNLEANHATLAGHTFQHELTMASAADLLGSLDANRGDPLLGWDTDQFPTNLYSTTYAMLVILNQGGLSPGGLNFDAKTRRESVDPVDLFHAHIGGMDSFARSLLIAHRMREDGVFSNFREQRYESYQTGVGKRIMNGETGFEELEKHTLEHGEPDMRSGRQEALENIVNDYL